ncbi:TIGR02677 family protein [Lactonifactor longoviformis]|uniref:TIGR02677 family protein n=1 Tax=Lactonifactor TaxID=420345 RepID=UPI0012B138C3|nr:MULTISPECIES: TIGR02677 family protein [Lactonifactor]MCQ4669746.1 TIGR02677 family protein [Lactonifactor longoviformis]MSA03281.1 TIGR02677 family protein [Lactonifactor sp. BIOML-A5]MSA09459.1 TIGR02677 family protein [Lactonifactor sp. BIOML-A4]MSA15217.1 TIGR02677 family protein [Lactonifactor sp. BIOML-A3]MSA18507.1 TIGR02677 family protein [Lactonifactor sp. BIOML-A2]
MKYLEAIEEAAYLSVPSSPQYRKIMRVCYQEYEKMHFQLYKEEIYEQLREEPEFVSYTIEQLKIDLEALVKWKNLTPIQDPGRVYTIADYKNKQYRYTMSEYAVEIERMTVRLENLFLESGNLSTNLFVRLERGLDEAEDMKQCSLKEVNEWWRNIQEDFKRLNQNYQDYLRDFYSGRTDHLLKSVEFIVHKDKFIKYLHEFVQELQNHGKKISRILEKHQEVIEGVLLEKVVQSELEIPHALLELHGDAKSSIRENVRGKWESLKNWFLDTPEHGCECSKVLRITNDIIRSIIQNAALIVQVQNWGISRKDDYKKFLKLFADCGNMEDAHKLSAHIFGVQNIQHFKANAVRETDGITGSVYGEAPMEYLLKPHTRNYREKRDRQGFADKSFEKLLRRNEYLQRIEREKRLVLRYIKDNRLEFSRIEETVPETARIVFLQWIAQANMNSEKKGRTEFGQEFRLVNTGETCVLKCEDGDLRMPAYILEFDL